MRVIRVASRRSQLAMTQTKWVIDQLQTRRPDWSFDIVPITTKGDQVLNVTLSKVGGKGLFVTEIEEVLVSDKADIAVHSLKDVPYELGEGLILAGIPAREDPRDAFISHSGLTLQALPEGAVVGTSSLRRAAQIKRLRPDLKIEPLRGNIDSRLQRAEEGAFDAIILAAAGLHRMGWANRITQYLSVDECIPAVGQGVLGVECRVSDQELVEELRTWSDARTVRAAAAERALLYTLQGSCQVPIAGFAQDLENGELQLNGLVADPDGSRIIQDHATGMDPTELGRRLAHALLDNGARAYLDSAGEEGDTVDGR